MIASTKIRRTYLITVSNFPLTFTPGQKLPKRLQQFKSKERAAIIDSSAQYGIWRQRVSGFSGAK